MPVYARRERNDQLHTCTHEQTQQHNNDHAMLWSRQFDHSTCRAALARLSLAELSWASSRLVHEPRLLCRKRKGRNIAESTAVSMGPLRERSRFVAAHRARQNRPGTGGTGTGGTGTGGRCGIVTGGRGLGSLETISSTISPEPFTDRYLRTIPFHMRTITWDTITLQDPTVTHDLPRSESHTR